MLITHSEIESKFLQNEKRLKELGVLNSKKNISFKKVFEINDKSSENIIWSDSESCYLEMIDETEQALINKREELRNILDAQKNLNNSKLFKFEVDKILGYNQVNELYFDNIKKIKYLKHTDVGKKYQYEIAQQVKKLNLNNYIKPKPTFYKLIIEFHINYEQKDVDGLKTFVDCLFRALAHGDRTVFDDSQVVNIELMKTHIRKNNEKKEFILVKFIEFNDVLRDETSLYSEYLNQRLSKLR